MYVLLCCSGTFSISYYSLEQSERCIDLPVIIKLTLMTPRVKSWVIQSFLTFDSVDRTLYCYLILLNL